MKVSTRGSPGEQRVHEQSRPHPESARPRASSSEAGSSASRCHQKRKQRVASVAGRARDDADPGSRRAGRRTLRASRGSAASNSAASFAVSQTVASRTTASSPRVHTSKRSPPQPDAAAFVHADAARREVGRVGRLRADEAPQRQLAEDAGARSRPPLARAPSTDPGSATRLGSSRRFVSQYFSGWRICSDDRGGRAQAASTSAFGNPPASGLAPPEERHAQDVRAEQLAPQRRGHRVQSRRCSRCRRRRRAAPASSVPERDAVQRRRPRPPAVALPSMSDDSANDASSSSISFSMRASKS